MELLTIMSQTKYKIDRNRKDIVIYFCRLYVEYVYSDNILHTKIVQAIDNNRYLIGANISDECIKYNLRNAIWYSVLDMHKYPYEIWDLPIISRNEFYELRRRFISGIAAAIGI